VKYQILPTLKMRKNEP
jgi:hypothetical protein